MFSENRLHLEEIKQQLAEDDLPAMATSVRGILVRTDMPELSQSQLDAYRQLFSRLSFDVTVFRNETSTLFRLHSQTKWGTTHMYAFVSGKPRDGLPSCDIVEKTATCGECILPYEDGWHLEYRWSDGSGVPTQNGCIDPETMQPTSS